MAKIGARRARKKRIPLTLVTGFLGSGKTTLVNRILTERRGALAKRKLAVLVNELGSIGIDGDLIRGSERSKGGTVLELANGCLCCLVTGEFGSALHDLVRMRPDLDQILIETSGAADPTALMKTLWGAPELSQDFRLDGVVCVVDGERFAKTDDELLRTQAAVADLLLISKADRASASALKQVCAKLEEINRWAEAVQISLDSKLPIPAILHMDAGARPMPRFLRVRDDAASHGALTSVAASWEGKVPRARLQEFFQKLILKSGKDVLRVKGLLHVEGEKRPWLIQGVQTWIEKSAAPTDYSGANKLVVIGRDLNKADLKRAIGRLRG